MLSLPRAFGFPCAGRGHRCRLESSGDCCARHTTPANLSTFNTSESEGCRGDGSCHLAAGYGHIDLFGRLGLSYFGGELYVTVFAGQYFFLLLVDGTRVQGRK